MVTIELKEEGADDLVEYSRVSTAFRVERVLVLEPERGPLAFREVDLEVPSLKDYDTEPGAHPTSWVERFDTSTWRTLIAWRGAERVAGAVLLQGIEGIEMLEGRGDLALIWDLRVSPGERGAGLGSRLIQEIERWARARGCTELKVETQNINVPACRFYERMGFELRAVDPEAYPGLDEIQMLWYKTLDATHLSVGAF